MQAPGGCHKVQARLPGPGSDIVGARLAAGPPAPGGSSSLGSIGYATVIAGRSFSFSDDTGPSDEGGRRHGRPLGGRGDDRRGGAPGTGSARWSTLRSRSASPACSRVSSPALLLSTLALDGSDAARRRPSLLLRYADLGLLALALPVFVLAGPAAARLRRRRRGVARPARDPRARRPPRAAPRSAAATGARRSA